MTRTSLPIGGGTWGNCREPRSPGNWDRGSQASAFTSPSRMPSCPSRHVHSSPDPEILQNASMKELTVEPCRNTLLRALNLEKLAMSQKQRPSTRTFGCSQQVHAGYVMFWALLSPCYYWSEYGGMFHGPAQGFEKARLFLAQLIEGRLPLSCMHSLEPFRERPRAASQRATRSPRPPVTTACELRSHSSCAERRSLGSKLWYCSCQTVPILLQRRCIAWSALHRWISGRICRVANSCASGPVGLSCTKCRLFGPVLQVRVLKLFGKAAKSCV